ncbi:IspD/TarI family cytidylyltransferase [Weissella confusa]|uniref:IspD/TarI family cytidylyltransferase n=1 Tax=Weissella confusa TaxID=1583 RepID=UPI000704F2E9|nr:IspD/TarI family cytidylyltransferase [Weissella confusa]MBJ7655850.1 2-C-methyl-D-erythritol 4-phosphate cytidylyltransferase [Weissella confusa]MBJ7698665.1 2-C-methyl-D-erythritol 4-phosphate cytidylyltransferase [Weissella confusa]MBS7550615.1 2-C-methyl-D-erythritol 4-phosphate cytidylyltransferase [Weissella confusa]MCQ8096458.1 2-C-methyl-D-erythritol 4-phosphate cytidylyltransferase [Weissella confusa]MCQ8146338.1 2-C-methyl-D-erythritol 4-phosphate cytidylyltransferase [Weissella c
MRTAIIIAGGSGKRMQQDIPKQFLSVNGKPILIYTVESFQNHPLIDQVLLVVKNGWEDMVWRYVDQYKLTKVKWVIAGGKIGQESINNGVQFLKDKISGKDTVVIHDGIRPIVDDYVLSDVVLTAEEKSNAVSALPYNEQIFLKDDDESTSNYIDRNTIMRVMTPQAYRFDLLVDGYDKALADNVGMTDSSYTNTMMVELGYKLYFALGSEKNIKITRPDDLLIFKALLELGD